jgi:tetratricopeptide (TPR) repeat protein
MMRESHGDQLRSGSVSDGAERLDSWKEIATFFRREVRTVQLWERHEQLPVHRHQHRKVGTVHAFRPELQEWWNRRCSAKAEEGNPPPPSPNFSVEKQQSGTQTTLAILPFRVSLQLQDDLDRQLAHRFTERIVASLDLILPPRLQVVCNLSAAQRHAKGFTPEDANCDFVADYALEGSINGTASCIQIELQLRRVKDQTSIWSRTCESTSIDLLVTAADLADKVARALSHHLLVSHYKVKSSAVNPAARFAYLRGRYLWSLRSTPLSLFNALEQFRVATNLDPNYAPAFSGLADCYTVLGWFGAIPRESAMREARRAANRALSIDGYLAEAHVSMGCVHFDFDWDWEAAEREMLRGIDLNPSYAQAYCWYSLLLVSLQRSQEAVHAAQVAQDLDPASPVVGAILGSALFHATQHAAAIQQFLHVLNLQPDQPLVHCRLGLAYEQTGNYGHAIEHLELAERACQGDLNIQSMLAFVYARSGNRSAAAALLDNVRQREKREPVPAMDAAAAFAALGDHESALDYLYAGFEERNARMTTLRSDPRLKPLHSDARFQSLVRQMRLE